MSFLDNFLAKAMPPKPPPITMTLGKLDCGIFMLDITTNLRIPVVAEGLFSQLF